MARMLGAPRDEPTSARGGTGSEWDCGLQVACLLAESAFGWKAVQQDRELEAILDELKGHPRGAPLSVATLVT